MVLRTSLSKSFLLKSGFLAPIEAEILFGAGFAPKRLKRIAGRSSLLLLKFQMPKLTAALPSAWQASPIYEIINPTGFQNLSSCEELYIWMQNLISTPNRIPSIRRCTAVCLYIYTLREFHHACVLLISQVNTDCLFYDYHFNYLQTG